MERTKKTLAPPLPFLIITAALVVFLGLVGPAHGQTLQTIFEHVGSTDPTTEGWTQSQGAAFPASAFGPLTPDPGFGINAWFIDDNSNALSTTMTYKSIPTDAQIAQASALGWKLSWHLRVVDVSDPVNGVDIEYANGTKRYTAVFGSTATGNPIIRLADGTVSGGIFSGGPSFTPTDSGYHLYELVFDPVAGSADLFVDGIEVISDYPGHTFQVGAGKRVSFGAGGSITTGQGNWNLVQFSVGSEPIPDHFLSYRVKRTKGAPKFERREVTLKDQFLEGTFRVDKPEELLNPADKNGEGISDPDTHLLAYKVKPPEEFEDFKLSGILVENQFGEFVVNIEEPKRLLVPASKSLTSPLPPPDPQAHNVDHFLCYKIEDEDEENDDEEAPLAQAFVQDQFNGVGKLFDIKKPRWLCNPVEKQVGDEVAEIKNPENHLLCFGVKPARGELKHERILNISVTDQLDFHLLDAEKERDLCVPSTKTPPGP